MDVGLSDLEPCLDLVYGALRVWLLLSYFFVLGPVLASAFGPLDLPINYSTLIFCFLFSSDVIDSYVASSDFNRLDGTCPRTRAGRVPPTIAVR